MKIHGRKTLHRAVISLFAAAFFLIQAVFVTAPYTGMPIFDRIFKWTLPALWLVAGMMQLASAFSEKMSLATEATLPFDERDRQIISQANAMTAKVLEVTLVIVMVGTLMLLPIYHSVVLGTIGLTCGIVVCLMQALRIGFALYYQRG
ncbi:hypothetical protein [Bifidobacterium callimiconis]|uniref:Uncharacterized protein n=1 Tax=Bifidobacterium callimiconis TaxID=2306973 RepID=A0A430FHJ9_9BIFI|nr:hypothetical protein [Bifidobacterium callimiconis]MBT1177899.1 hypothetical protein [Bifidobacterium callimiconis]RSX52364.1 hypothetical protein D2E23_0092 [Bifidobacterium callimiconis]